MHRTLIQRHAINASHSRILVRTVCITLLAATIAACEPRAPSTSKQRARGEPPEVELGAAGHGRELVITDDPLASTAGLEMMARGGNAVDAAIAAALALAVVRPEAGNLGGGGFLLIHMNDEGITTFIDCREIAPAAAQADMLLDASGTYDVDRALWSGLSCGVPGNVAGLEHAHRSYGRLSWEELFEPALALASNGFQVSTHLHDLFLLHEERLSRYPESKRLFIDGGLAAAKNAEPWVQHDLARTLRAIQTGGAGAFYHGDIAEMIAAQVERTGGIMTVEDLASYEVAERPPVRGHYRGLEVISAPPPSSGGAVLLLLLHMSEELDLGALSPDDPRSRHRLIEIMRRAFALRSTELGDPDQVDIDVSELLSGPLAERLAATIGTRATPSESLTDLGLRPAHAMPRESEDTTHLTVIDRLGNVVAFTTTLNASFGSGVAVEGAGFLLNNEMDDFTASPGTPNLYGLIQGERNAIAPGRRPVSSMTPTIVLDGVRPVMALGSPGGPRIISAVFQVIVHQIEFGMDAQEAVERPRIHHQTLPDHVMLETDALGDTARAALVRLGHELASEPRPIGHVHLATRGRGDVWLGIADQRRGGAVATFDRDAETRRAPER